MNRKVQQMITIVVAVISIVASLMAVVLFFLDRPIDFTNSTGILIIIIPLISTSCVAVITSLLFQKKNRDESAKYDFIREKLESEIAEIQKKLSSNENQWRESFHLLLSAQNKAPDTNISIHSSSQQPNIFLNQFGIDGNTEIDKKLVFYLTPFSNESQSTFKIVKEVCLDSGLNILRGDEEFVKGDIFTHIIKQIAKARIIIANIDGKNANVFYELGIAHAIGKAVILISRSYNAPFDIQSNRIICYENDEQLRESLFKQISKALVEN